MDRVLLLSRRTRPGSQSQNSADSNPEGTCSPGGRGNDDNQLLWEVECGLGSKPEEDVDEKVDADPEEKEDVGMGNHKKTEHREDVAVSLDADQRKMITGEDVAHGHDKD